MGEFVDAVGKLVGEASLYEDAITSASKDAVRVCLELSDTEERATLVIDDEITVVEGAVNPDLKIHMRNKVFRRLLKGEADAFALAGRASPAEKRPVDFELYDTGRQVEALEAAKALLTYLFLPGRVKTRRLEARLAGEAHGAHPIPIAYWNGMRFSWILVKAGETLNEEGEKDPWSQVFIPIRGKGRAQIHDEEFDVRTETAIYVPRNTVHKIAAETDVELLWLAWQAGPI